MFDHYEWFKNEVYRDVYKRQALASGLMNPKVLGVNINTLRYQVPGGMLLALNLPVALPWWEAVLGGVFAIIIVKCMFEMCIRDRSYPVQECGDLFYR